MLSLPRLALATAANDPEPSLASLAFLGGLTELGWKVQHFRAWACPLSTQIIGPVTGLPGRHLDGWLMPPDVLRAVFARGARGADLAVIEGTLDGLPAVPEPLECPWRALPRRHGALVPVIETLDCPIVAVIKCQGWRDGHLPWIPPEADAVLFEGVESREQFENLRTLVRMLTNKAVIGAVGSFPTLVEGLAWLPLGRALPHEWVVRLGASFREYVDIDALLSLADARPAPCPHCCDDAEVSCRATPPRRVRVAYAMDEAFGGYFPDTLETLELLGAELVEFSPLRDESLPRGADLVLVGCGFPDRFADQLAANHSLIAALRAHVCAGGRIYSEGGGTAYLGRFMLIEGRPVPGAGILPFNAELLAAPAWPEPVERTLAHDGWLGARGTSVRGYRSNRWVLHDAPEPGDCPTRSGVLTGERDIVFRYRAVGSLIHLHLGALPEVVSAFVGRPTPTPFARRER